MNQNESTWFYIPPEQIDAFKQEVYSLRFTWKDGTPFKLDHPISNFMAIHQDHTIAFISILCWKFSFACKTPVNHIHYPSGNVIKSLYDEKKEKKKN